MGATINWGIIGLGNIAHKFAHDLVLVQDANLYAVASRSIEKAKEFGDQYNADSFYGSYKSLLKDPNIDVVYIAVPHVYHCELTLQALDAGKAVVCEKPFGMNVREVEKMIAKAKEKNIFLMEALWTRFVPATEKILELINSGVIGKLQSVRADFGFKADYNPELRLFKKSLGGGALLDLGVYPIFLSLLTLGVPTAIRASTTQFPTNVDSSCMMLFNYTNQQTAILDVSLLVDTPIECLLHGENGTLKMSNPFHSSKEISLFKNRELVESYNVGYKGLGYYHEIEEVMNCLRDGKTESAKMPLSFSLQLIKLLDRVRGEIGLNYD